MANPQTSIAAGLTALVLQLLGQGELLLVDLDGLFQVAELNQHLPHVGQGPELGLVVLHQVGNGWRRELN